MNATTKQLLATTAIILTACVAPLTLANAAEQQPLSEQASDAWASLQKGAKETWDATVKAFDDATRASQQDIVLPKALPGAISAKTLIGTPIENAKEGRVGSISDLVLGNDNRVDAVVVSDGGFLGIANAQIPVKPRLVSIARQPDGTLKARTNVTEQQLDAAYSAAVTTRIEAMNDNFKKTDVKTVSRLIGAPVVDAKGESVGAVNDILLSPVGEARYALVGVGGTMGVGSKLVAVPVSSLTFTASDKPLKSNITAAGMKKLAPVRAQATAS